MNARVARNADRALAGVTAGAHGIRRRERAGLPVAAIARLTQRNTGWAA